MAVRILYVIIIFVGSFVLNGCATSRGQVSLTVPASDKVTAPNGMQIHVRSVSDKRIFEAAPKSPEIPSLDPSEPDSADIRRRAVARKRNTFGKGLGDILLQEGQTVESVVADSLRQALTEEGYSVVGSNPNPPKDLRIIDVEINKFWSWMNPGFWAITLSTEIDTGMTVHGPSGSQKKTISVKAADHFQTGFDSNWVSVMHAALKDYINEVKAQFK